MYKVTSNPQQIIRNADRSPEAAYAAALVLEEDYRSPLAAQYYYCKSAAGGYGPAMLKVAGLFMTGEYLVSECDGAILRRHCDPCLAFDLISRAAESDHRDRRIALYLLARCYAEGRGTAADPDAARRCLSRIDVWHDRCAYLAAEAGTFGNLSSLMTVLTEEVRKHGSHSKTMHCSGDGAVHCRVG